jgi:hypothetical protein
MAKEEMVAMKDGTILRRALCVERELDDWVEDEVGVESDVN